jgi:hypothetical protein
LLPFAHAGDWPQILGPNRNGVAVGEKLADHWPAEGPKTVWQREVGGGYAGLAVKDNVAILFHRRDDKETVEALEARTGKLVWKSEAPASYQATIIDDDGPRAVPVIAGSSVYTYGAAGQLRCLEWATGKQVWSRDTYNDFNSKKEFHGEPPQGYFGFASSPIVEDGLVIVNVGGDSLNSGIVAFDAATGKTVWKATSERASYSSPVAVIVGGVRHLIVVTRLHVVSLDPATGKERFRFAFGRTGPTVNAATPVVWGNHLFVTASYGIGAVLVRIKPDQGNQAGPGFDIEWRDDELLSSQYSTPLELDGSLIGLHGRQDGPPAELRCIDPLARKVLWTRPDFGYATLIRCGNKLLITLTDGTILLASAGKNGYDELARKQVCDTTVRALPALSNGYLFVRDTKVLKCLDLR